MTARSRSHRRQRPAGPASTLGEAIILDRIGALARAELRRRHADLAPLRLLAGALGVDAGALTAAAARTKGLGLCGPDSDPQVWSVAAGPLVAGFTPALAGERLVLRLPASEPGRAPLIVSGRRLGTSPLERGRPARSVAVVGGELGFAVARMTTLAQRWLTPRSVGELTERLFGLIATAWRRGGEPGWSSGALRVLRADLGQPVGIAYWNSTAPTSVLDVVVWAEDPEQPELVNVYPSSTHGVIFDERDPS